MVQNNNETGMTRALGSFAQALEYEDLSPEVIDWARYLCLDLPRSRSTAPPLALRALSLTRCSGWTAPGRRWSSVRPTECCRSTPRWPTASPFTA